MYAESSKKKEIETIEAKWVANSQNDRVVRKYFQVSAANSMHLYLVKTVHLPLYDDKKGNTS